MAYTPDLDWVDDAPPGFDAARMTKMQLGIQDAAAVADSAAQNATQALANASAAQQDASEALALVGSGGIHTVDDDVLRVYRSTTTPSDGVQPGDLVVSAMPSAAGPAEIPGLMRWIDAVATGSRDLGVVLPDVSGNENHVDYRVPPTSDSPATVGSLNGLPAFEFHSSRYYDPTAATGPRTYAGVCRFDSILTTQDHRFFYTGSPALILGVRNTTGNLYLDVDGTTVYEAPASWLGGSQLPVSFVISVGAQATLWLSGVQVAQETVTGGGDRGALAFSNGGSGFFVGVLGEFAEFEGTVAPAQAVALSNYFREKWRV